jgi:hypothetical protein
MSETRRVIEFPRTQEPEQKYHLEGLSAERLEALKKDFGDILGLLEAETNPNTQTNISVQ